MFINNAIIKLSDELFFYNNSLKAQNNPLFNATIVCYNDSLAEFIGGVYVFADFNEQKSFMFFYKQ